ADHQGYECGRATRPRRRKRGTALVSLRFQPSAKNIFKLTIRLIGPSNGTCRDTGSCVGDHQAQLLPAGRRHDEASILHVMLLEHKRPLLLSIRPTASGKGWPASSGS